MALSSKPDLQELPKAGGAYRSALVAYTEALSQAGAVGPGAWRRQRGRSGCDAWIGMCCETGGSTIEATRSEAGVGRASNRK
jgi:hypothetical protein